MEGVLGEGGRGAMRARRRAASSCAAGEGGLRAAGGAVGGV